MRKEEEKEARAGRKGETAHTDEAGWSDVNSHQDTLPNSGQTGWRDLEMCHAKDASHHGDRYRCKP